jgi:hypothetical protein
MTNTKTLSHNWISVVWIRTKDKTLHLRFLKRVGQRNFWRQALVALGIQLWRLAKHVLVSFRDLSPW